MTEFHYCHTAESQVLLNIDPDFLIVTSDISVLETKLPPPIVLGDTSTAHFYAISQALPHQEILSIDNLVVKVAMFIVHLDKTV